MTKDQVYIGMVLMYEQYEVLVTEKQDKCADVLWLSTGEINGVPYDELKTIPSGATYFKMYNNRVREAQSKYSGKFVKNEQHFKFESGDSVWFTSDTHFCHDNIIRFCDRPYVSVEEMNQAIVDRWNSIVKPDDTVFHLGDFCWGGSASWEWILSRLNGHIHLIIGNHDVKNLRQGYMKHFESVSFQAQIEVEGQSIYLNHYPFLTYGGIYRKDPVWQLFGHVHSKSGNGGADSGRLQFLLPTQYDVGVDNNDYLPVSFAQVKQIIQAQLADADRSIEDTVKDPNRDLELEHLHLQLQIAKRCLTPEGMKQFEELTIDKGQ